MAIVRFLHLSDLHISDTNVNEARNILQALWNDLKNIDQVDYILFNGDLINNGSRGAKEYDIALDSFILPLLGITEVAPENFFIVPGNHDVDRSKIEEFRDAGLSNKFRDETTLNRFFDQGPSTAQMFERLDSFYQFIELVRGDEFRSSDLCRSYVLDHGGLKFGIACLNSSWCAEGDDYGNLLIGERQIDQALMQLQDCTFRVAMVHHPLDWIKEFDRTLVYERLLSGFHLVCTGHVHREMLTKTTSQDANTIFVQASALFSKGMDSGYSIITYDSDKSSVEVAYRQYYERRREFDLGLSVVRSGKVQFTLAGTADLSSVKQNLVVKQALHTHAIEAFNRQLMTYSTDTHAPKHVDSIYVPPYMSRQPESFTTEKVTEETTDDLDKILAEHRHILFIGKREMGKTTLLNYICHRIQLNPEPIIPFIIDFRALVPGKHTFPRAMTSYLHECNYFDFDLLSNLEEGNCLLLIDNVDMRDSRKMALLKQFCEQYSNNRFILTTHEEVIQTLKLVDLPDIGVEYTPLYLYTLRRNQIRSLTQKWFSWNQGINIDVVLDRVVMTLRRIGIPRTPFSVSLLLWILEKQSDYVPLNEASLVDRVIEVILEKLTLSDIRYDTVDYTIKIDFLSNVAHWMVQKNRFNMADNELDSYIIEYFSEKGLEVHLQQFKEFFFEKGIFVAMGRQIGFHFRCFFEYFLAKYMETNPEFADWALTPERYLNFANEIVYLTGLSKRRLDLIQLIEQRLEESFEIIDGLVDLDELSKIPARGGLPQLIKGDDARAEIAAMEMTDAEKDAELEDGVGTFVQEISDKSSTYKIEQQFLSNLMLYGKILRNSELVSRDTKEDGVKRFIQKSSMLTALFYRVSYELVATELDMESLTVENKQDWQYILTVGIPIVMQSLNLNTMGTPKLKVILQSAFESAKSDIERLMIVSLYGDLRLDDYIAFFQKFIDMTTSRVMREIALIKMMSYVAYHAMSREDREALINRTADLYTLQRNLTQRERDGLVKSLRRAAVLNTASQRAE